MRKIGKYEILGLLGKGGMSRVYKARDPFTEQILALKLLAPHPHLVTLLGQREIARRFVAEAALMAELDSRHIVSVRDQGEDAGRPFLVMEYYCHNLGQLLGETYRLESLCRVLRLDKAIRLTRETLLGISSLHRAGVVHRDIKPFNVLLTDQERVKIADFGMSKLRGERFSEPHQLLVGSPYYAAPEQEQAPDRVDRRADLYSLGVMLYRMLTGWLPVEGFVPPSSSNPELDENWDAMLRKAMALRREERYASAEAMLQELDRLHRLWLARLDDRCKGFETQSASGPAREHSVTLRSKAGKIALGKAMAEFQVDELWRPRRYHDGSFQAKGNATVSDAASGLTWQQAGSPEPLTWQESHQYVAALNAKRFAGRKDWRLPTIAELMSLLTPVPREEDYCLRPVFCRDQKWLWSIDRCTFTSAWYVNSGLGYVSRQDFSCRFFVRAVSSS